MKQIMLPFNLPSWNGVLCDTSYGSAPRLPFLYHCIGKHFYFYLHCIAHICEKCRILASSLWCCYGDLGSLHMYICPSSLLWQTDEDAMYLFAASSSVDCAVELTLLDASYPTLQFHPLRHTEAFCPTQGSTFLPSFLLAVDALASASSLAHPFVGRREQLR